MQIRNVTRLHKFKQRPTIIKRNSWFVSECEGSDLLKILKSSLYTQKLQRIPKANDERSPELADVNKLPVYTLQIFTKISGLKRKGFQPLIVVTQPGFNRLLVTPDTSELLEG